MANLSLDKGSDGLSDSETHQNIYGCWVTPDGGKSANVTSTASYNSFCDPY